MNPRTDTLVLGPPRQITALLALLAATFAMSAAFADPAARVLLVPGALIAAVAVGRDLVLRPVLQADQQGLTVVASWRRVSMPWPGVIAMTVRTDRRTPVLDLDLGAMVVVLSRGRLGRAPGAVLAELQALRAAYKELQP